MGAAREPGGVRAKIAVSSNSTDKDPVGACVGDSLAAIKKLI